MTKNPFLTSCVITLSASLLLAANGLASEEYDVKAYGPKSPIVWTTPIKATFDHSIHTMDAGLDCSSCHDDIFSMQRGTAVNSKKFTMKAMAEGDFCGSCHDGDTAFATDTNCMACHSVSEEPLVWHEPTKAAFSHTSHVEEMELACNDCHSGTFEMKKGAATAANDFTMAAFKDGKYCGACHNGDDAFDSASQCESCHFPPKGKIVFNEPVKSVVFDHDIHVGKAELSCESCHKEVFTMKQGTLAGEKLIQSDNPAEKRKYLEALHSKYCGTCHDSSQAFGYLTRCTVCHIGVKGYNKMQGGDKKNSAHGKSGH
jgi:c(7)-type cytochrome triheme protein